MFEYFQNQFKASLASKYQKINVKMGKRSSKERKSGSKERKSGESSKSMDLDVETDPSPPKVEFQAREELVVKKKQTLSQKAGLTMPVIKMYRALKKGKYAKLIQKG